MQSVQEIVKLGYGIGNARQMYSKNMSHIGEVYGCNKIVDVNYTPNHERDITLECTICGKVSHKIFVGGRNKWCEMKRTCECQVEKNFPKIQKSQVVRNDDPSFMNKTFDDFEVIGFSLKPHKNKSGGTVIWDVKCIHCGRVETGKSPSTIKKGVKCKCQKEKERNELWQSRIGERYGKLTIESFIFRKFDTMNVAYAVCTCDCGNKHSTQYTALRSGQTKSCGCIEEARCDGHTKSPLYPIWGGMRQRCNNPNNAAYKDYGGRGIKVCDEWNDSETGFRAFEKWAYENGYAPDLELSLDRIDVNGNYEPSNCRYANVYIQTVNRRKRRNIPREKKLIEIDGESRTKEEWCKEYGISVSAVDYRMKTLNMPFEMALKTPKSRKGNIFAGEQAKRRSKEINQCESYIEANLLLAFIRNGGDLRLVSQESIGKYRVDFIVAGTNVIVECDGYDSHKTKEQITHDNQRDRFLQKNGYIVLRFGGAEINADPDKCALEIVDFVNTVCGDRHEDRKTNAG